MLSPTSVDLATSPDGIRGRSGDAMLQSSSASPPPPLAFASSLSGRSRGNGASSCRVPPVSRVAGVSLSFEDLRVSTAPTLPLLKRAGRAARQWAHERSGAGRLWSVSPPPPLPPVPTKHILKGASGFIPANSLTGVMGGSGAGKTTLLNFLAHRLPGCGQTHAPPVEQAARAARAATEGGYAASGSIRCNGQAVSAKFFASACAYVPQQSILLSALTPRESVAFASRLRLDAHTSAEEHRLNTDRVLSALSLHSCANTRAGDELTGSGLSGGEKRRTNIGVELVTSPPLLFLDEPTTGLDSLTALSVLQSLKQLTQGTPRKRPKAARVAPPAHRRALSIDNEQPGAARSAASAGAAPPEDEDGQRDDDDGSEGRSSGSNGVTVVCSLHQPSAEQFSLLDNLILLSSGRIVYCGPADAALAYFACRGFPCPPLENPPEYFLDCCTNPAVLPMLEKEYASFYAQHYRHLHCYDPSATAAAAGSAAPKRHEAPPSCEGDAESLLGRDDTPEPPPTMAITHRKSGGAAAMIYSPATLHEPYSSTATPYSGAGAGGAASSAAAASAAAAATAGLDAGSSSPSASISISHASYSSYVAAAVEPTSARGVTRLDLGVAEMRAVRSNQARQERDLYCSPSPPVREQNRRASLHRISEEHEHDAGAYALQHSLAANDDDGGADADADDEFFSPSERTHLQAASASPPRLISSRPASFRGRVFRSMRQLQYLTQRAHLNASRLPLLKLAQVLQTVALGLLVGLAFLHLGRDQTAVQNRLGCVYFIAICVIFANTLSVILNFAEERAVFLREQGSQMYAVWTYFIARTSIDFLPTFLCSLGLAVICFWMIDPSASGVSFGRFLLMLVLLAYAGQGIGLVVSCGIGSRMLAMVVAPLAIAPFILFTPYAVNPATIPPYFRPVQVGSPFWWGFIGLMVTFFSGARFHCTPGQTIPVPLADGTFHLMCVYQTGEDVLESFNIHARGPAADSQYWLCCAVLLLLCCVYRLLALLMLYRLSWSVKDATK